VAWVRESQRVTWAMTGLAAADVGDSKMSPVV
jgi:hypothetical protein